MRQNIIQYHKDISCVVLPYDVLFCLILFYPVFTVLQIKRTYRGLKKGHSCTQKKERKGIQKLNIVSFLPLHDLSHEKTKSI